MKAVRFDELGRLDHGSLQTVEDPTPGPGAVVIAVEAVPVNFVDLLTISGRYQFSPALPHTPGKGPAGTVLEVGSDVTTLRPGDRVLAMAESGGYAERVVADHRQCHVLPRGISAVAAASMAVSFDTAWMALRERARMMEGESVLVLGGSGAVGFAAIELARAFGASRILATASSADRVPVQFLDDPEGVIDLSKGALRDSIRDQVRVVLPQGVDVVIDALGGDAFDGAVRALAWRGRIVTVGYASGRIPTLKVNYLMLKNIAASGLQISDYRRHVPDLVAEAFGEIFGLLEAGRINAPEVEVMALEDWSTALNTLGSRASQRRLVLVPGPST